MSGEAVDIELPENSSVKALNKMLAQNPQIKSVSQGRKYNAYSFSIMSGTEPISADSLLPQADAQNPNKPIELTTIIRPPEVEKAFKDLSERYFPDDFELWIEKQPEARADKEFVLEAIKKYKYSLEGASEDLRNDKEVVMQAVKKNGSALRNASEELQQDKDFIMEAVSNNKYTLGWVKPEAQDKEVVLAALAKDEGALKFASEDLRKNKEVVLKGVSDAGYNLQFASEALRNDRDVVLAAVKNYGSALEYASEEIRNDRDVVLAAVGKYGLALQFASEDLQKDKQIVCAAVENCGSALEHASEALRGDKEVVLAAVSKTGYGDALQYASDSLKQDEKIANIAKQNGYNPEGQDPPRRSALASACQNLSLFSTYCSSQISAAVSRAFNFRRRLTSARDNERNDQTHSR